MPRQEVIDRTKRLMQEAKALMDLDAAAHEASPNGDFEELDYFADTIGLDGDARDRVAATGRAMKSRMENVRRLSQMGVHLFEDLFGLMPPQGTAMDVGPYTMYFTMPAAAYEGVIRQIGLKEGYASSAGLCLPPWRIKPEFQEAIGGSVAFIRAMEAQSSGTLPVKICIDGVVYDTLEVYNGALTATRRHERHHTIQNIMDSNYHMPDGIGGSLMREEAAEAVSEGPESHQWRRLVMHTKYYSEHDIPEGEVGRLAAKLFKKPKRACKFIRYRQGLEDALRRAYGDADKRLIGFSLNLINFKRATSILPVMASVGGY